MPLESLNNEQINIHDLTLEQEKRPKPEWERQYDAMKETPLYDSDLGLWHTYFNPSESKGSASMQTADQQLGVMIENYSNPKKAEGMYNHIKDRRFYDFERKVWQMYYDSRDDEPSPPSQVCTKSQLMGILLQRALGKEGGLQSFIDLKYEFFDTKHQLWEKFPRQERFKSGEKGRIGDRNPDAKAVFTSEDQFLSVLIESSVNINKAKKNYELIKEIYFDKDKGFYYSSFSDTDSPNNIYIGAQLLGVLAEAKFDKGNAKKLYSNLKSQNYNEETGYWFTNTPALKDSFIIRSDAQLTGVICEKEFEEKENDIIDQTPPLPEKRNY